MKYTHKMIFKNNVNTTTLRLTFKVEFDGVCCCSQSVLGHNLELPSILLIHVGDLQHQVVKIAIFFCPQLISATVFENQLVTSPFYLRSRVRVQLALDGQFRPVVRLRHLRLHGEGRCNSVPRTVNYTNHTD